MELNWQPPSEWEQAGIHITNVTGLKTSAWTLILAGKETRNTASVAGGPTGKAAIAAALRECDVVIKVFNVPRDIVQDPVRIAKERDKFLAAARLQKRMGDSAAPGWVKVRAISEDATSPAYVMDKCGPSLQDFINNRAHLSDADLYAIVLAVVDALGELFAREKRSHGNLKASDILAYKGTPAYKLADPAAEGETHSANDLYALGQVLFKLIEHKDYDPLVPLATTKAWDRFGARRDRWVQFCTMLLNPNGWHEPLGQVKKEALRLKPVARLRPVAIALVGVAIVAAGAIMADRFLHKAEKQETGNVAATTAPATTIHADATAELAAAKQAYNSTRDRFTTAFTASHYDHTKSRELARKSRAETPDNEPFFDDAGCRAVAAKYRTATATLEEALKVLASEDEAGKAQDAAADQAKTSFQQASAHYRDLNAQWNKALQSSTADTTQAKNIADAAHAMLPDQWVLTDPASFREGARRYTDAANGLDQALAVLAKAPPKQVIADTHPPVQDHPPVIDTHSTSQTQTPTGPSTNPPAANAATAIARGNDALTRQQFAEALKWYRTAADDGNAAAMCNVGLLYETGKGTAKDPAQAMDWYKRAAEKQYTPAIVNLASMYERQQDFGKAFTYYKQAAEANNAGAMVRLGHFYEEGKGTDENTNEAVKWYRRAADLNNSEAMTDLGVLYSRGYGVQLDDAEALKWFQKAAALKNPAAMNGIGGMYDAGHGVKQDPIEAMKWYKKAAELGFAPAMTNIGTLYDGGQGVPRDPAEAMNWFRKAADAGDGMGMFNIGVLFETGRGVNQNIAEALTWYRRAEKAGDPNARQAALDRIGRLGFPP
jgi:TPR repeat protein